MRFQGPCVPTRLFRNKEVSENLLSACQLFLDKKDWQNFLQTTFEIEGEKITKYIGNYSDLKTQKKKVLQIGSQPKRR